MVEAGISNGWHRDGVVNLWLGYFFNIKARDFRNVFQHLGTLTHESNTPDSFVSMAFSIKDFLALYIILALHKVYFPSYAKDMKSNDVPCIFKHNGSEQS